MAHIRAKPKNVQSETQECDPQTGKILKARANRLNADAQAKKLKIRERAPPAPAKRLRFEILRNGEAQFVDHFFE